MGNRRRKKFNPKYAALSRNIHYQRKEVLENSVMIEQLRLENERQAQMKAEQEAEVLRHEQEKQAQLKARKEAELKAAADLKAKQDAELKAKLETTKPTAPVKKKSIKKMKTTRKPRIKKD